MEIHTEGLSLPGEPRRTEARSRRTQEAIVGSCPGSPTPCFIEVGSWQSDHAGPSSLIGHLSMSQGLPQTPIWGEDGGGAVPHGVPCSLSSPHTQTRTF